ncbi:AQP13 [Ramazzottius varieornatus]|uniref:AQP13 n=1 Tax=Ramazzottius varieornatus TaxID=947166 RepID=A0A1D1VBU3_RAMVA|nr:AQP13 [Ramazzottius varieornatus]
MEKSEVRDRIRQVLEQYAKSPSWTPRQELRQPLFWKCIRAEFIGSLILMVFTTSASNGEYLPSISYGCVITILTYIFKATSIHFNPVVSLSASLLRAITPFRCICLILAQSLGSLSGATVVCLGLTSTNGTITTVSPTVSVSASQGFGYEFFATFLLMLTMASHLECPTDDQNYPLIMGIATTAVSSFAHNATGGFLNPFRALSLALFHRQYSSHYVYWLGPVLGSLLAVFTHDFLRPSRSTRSDTLHRNANGNLTSLPVAVSRSQEAIQMDSEFTIATLT